MSRALVAGPDVALLRGDTVALREIAFVLIEFRETVCFPAVAVWILLVPLVLVIVFASRTAALAMPMLIQHIERNNK